MFSVGDCPWGDPLGDPPGDRLGGPGDRLVNVRNCEGLNQDLLFSWEVERERWRTPSPFWGKDGSGAARSPFWSGGRIWEEKPGEGRGSCSIFMFR